ncbi:retrovirus-related pol polyprotein from transposon TNT 1-94 [Tanacetum coccineum]
MKVKESLNVSLDETPPPPKISSLEGDALVEEEAIKVSKTKPIGNDLEDISLENNQIVNIIESKTHPLENVIGNLNQRTLRSQAQDKIYMAQHPGFIDFAKPNYVFRLKKALYGLKQATKACAPNAPSKTPSTKDTSSSLIEYTPKSPTLSSSLSTNSYLNPPLSPPPRVPPPPPTQAPNSMEITLSLSPITPLDVHHNSPSLSPPIIGHPIP